MTTPLSIALYCIARNQFILRTMFVVVTLVAVAAWAETRLAMIRERHKLIFDDAHTWRLPRWDGAPNGLWLFGEGTVQGIGVTGSNEVIERYQKAFPEAKVYRSPLP